MLFLFRFRSAGHGHGAGAAVGVEKAGLDPDDLGPVVGKVPGRVGADPDAREVNDTDPLERQSDRTWRLGFVGGLSSRLPAQDLVRVLTQRRRGTC